MIATLIGAIAGFFVANAVSRNRASALRMAPATNSAIPGPATGSNQTLTPEEIAAAVRRADENPRDFQTQKQIGFALYRYATMTEDVELLRRALPILVRASDLQSSDREVTVMLGNAYFDVGYFAKENAALREARIAYGKALAAEPNDADVLTDVGLTYFLESPPRMDLAAAEFRKSLDLQPRHEKTLRFMIEALIKLEKKSEAERYLEQLRSVNPQSPSIAELSRMLAGGSQPAG